MGSSGSIWVSLGLRTANFSKGIAKARGQLSGFQKMGAGLKTMFNPLTIGLASFVAIGAAVTDAVKTVAEFEKGMSGVKAVLGELGTDKNMAMLTQQAKDLGSTTAFTATEVSQLQKEFAKLGFDPKQIENMTEATLNLAAAAGTELAEAATVAGSTMRAFGLVSSDAGHVADVMAASFSKSALDMEDFSEAMKNAAPIARATGVSLEQAAAGAGILANAGIKGSKAGTDLKRIFSELVKDGKPLEESLADIGKEMDGAGTKAEKLAIAEKLVGERAKGALLIMVDQQSELGKLTTELEGADGAAKAMADTMLDNLSGDVTKATSAYEGLILSVDDGNGVFSAAGRTVVQAGTNILGMLTKINEGTFGVTDALKEYANLLVSVVSMGTAEQLFDTKKVEKFEARLKKVNVTSLDTRKGIATMVTEYKKLGLSTLEATKRATALVSSMRPIANEVMPEVVKETEGATSSLFKLSKTQQKAAAAAAAMAKDQKALAGVFTNVESKAATLSDVIGSMTLEPINLEIRVPTENLPAMVASVNEHLNQLLLDETAAKFEQLQMTTQAVASGAMEAFGSMSNSIIASMGEAENGMQQFQQAMVGIILDVIAQALAASIANAITGATGAAAVAGPLAPAVLPATIATMVGSTIAAFAAIPAFAEGVTNFGGGTALVGELGPELVNLPRGSDVIPNNELGGGGGMSLPQTITMTMKGNDVVAILNRQGKTAKYTQ